MKKRIVWGEYDQESIIKAASFAEYLLEKLEYMIE